MKSEMNETDLLFFLWQKHDYMKVNVLNYPSISSFDIMKKLILLSSYDVTYMLMLIQNIGNISIVDLTYSTI